MVYAAMRPRDFLPLGCAHSSREPRKPPGSHPTLRYGRKWCGVRRHRGRDGDQGELAWRPSAPSRSPAQSSWAKSSPSRSDGERPHLEPAAPAGMRRAIGSSSAAPRSAPPGRSAPRSSVTISRSSWMVELQRSDLREPRPRPGWRRLRPHLVPQPLCERFNNLPVSRLLSNDKSSNFRERVP